MKRVLLACAAIALLGCGGGDSTGPSGSIEGRWNLQAVNGQTLPFTYAVNPPNYVAEIVSDVVEANADGTYTETTTIRETNGTEVTTHDEIDQGTWHHNGSGISVTDSGGNTFNATVAGNKLTIYNGPFILIYARL